MRFIIYLVGSLGLMTLGCETESEVQSETLAPDARPSNADAGPSQSPTDLGATSAGDEGVPMSMDLGTLMDASLPVADAGSLDNMDASPPIQREDSEVPLAFSLTSTAFEEGTPIPDRHTCFGEDLQPKLVWRGAPEDTQSFVLFMLDETIGFPHWIVIDLPADTRMLREGSSDRDGLPEGALELPAYGGGPYHGPCTPPPGPHTYTFYLYALQTDTVDPPGAGPANLIAFKNRLDAEALAVAHLSGTCQPPESRP